MKRKKKEQEKGESDKKNEEATTSQGKGGKRASKNTQKKSGRKGKKTKVNKKEDSFKCDDCGGLWKASEWIQCDICDEWCCKGCTKMTEEEWAKVAGTAEEYFCRKCSED